MTIFPDKLNELNYTKNIIHGDFYFIAPDDIQNLNDISISDLVLVKMKYFVDPNEEYNPNGIKIIGERRKFNENGRPAYYEIQGVVCYHSINGLNTIETSEGIKVRNSYSVNNQVKYKFIPEAATIGKYIVKYIFSITKNIKIAINASGDVFFDTLEEAEKYTHYITFFGGELNNEDLIVVVNEKCIHYSHYDIFVNNELKQNIPHERLFNQLCSHIPSKETNYIRVFPIRPEWYEIIKI